VRPLNEEQFDEGYYDDIPELYSLIMSEIGIENTIKLAKLLGGQHVYFNKFDTVERPIRNKKIRDEFNGYNFKALAKKYNLTEVTIRNICSDIVNKAKKLPIDGQLSLLE
jgi:Mor family transcriptional regulator